MTIGTSAVRVDAAGKVTGAATYPADLVTGDAVHAVVVFTGHPHARLDALDTSRAERAPGVAGIFTAADVPENTYGLMMFDQPVLIPVGGRSCWEADHLAVVVAETTAQAHAAAALIDARWTPLPVVTDLDDALAPTALVHPDTHPATNVYCSYKIRKGDIDAGWAAADVTVAATYEVPYQEHAYLQPEAGVASVDDQGRLTVLIAGQWAHEDRQQVARALGLDEERVRIVYPAIGGAFGGREDMSLQIVLALAALRLSERGVSRPVAARWSREESMIGHHKRHRGRITARLGATRDGRITAVEADCYLDAGAYNYTSNKVLANLHVTVAGPYEIPNARIDSHAVYTHNVPGGAFRGFGAPQGAFVAESQLNKLAHALGLDPVEVRRRNLISEDSVGITQAPFPAGVSIRKVVERCAAEAATGRADPGPVPVAPFAFLPSPASIRRGRGFACAFKNVGFSNGFPERCEATIVLHGDDSAGEPASADLFQAGAEVGQGLHTVLLQMASEATGVPVDRIRPHFSDTADSGDSGSASASRLTFMAGNAVLGAAEEAEKRWRDGDRPATGHLRFVPRPTQPLDAETGAADQNITYGYVAQAVVLSVDVETGHIVVHDVVNVSDVGRAINPALIHAQVHGAVVQAYGYAVTEHLQVRDARIVTPRLSTYLIPGIGDVPERIRSVLLEEPDPQGPWGARGMAEMPMLPLAPAIVAAVHDATGVWIDSLPLTPPRVVAALRAARA